MKKIVSIVLMVMSCFCVVLSASAAENGSLDRVEIFLNSIDNLEKDGIKLSRPTNKEIEELASIYKEPEIGYFLRNSDIELTEKEAIERLKIYNSGNSVSFVIKDKDENIVGEIMVTHVGNGIINLAYWIIPEYRGNNYATKACEVFISEVLEKCEEIIVLISSDKQNKASIKVIEKLKNNLLKKNDEKNNDINFIFKENVFKLKFKISEQKDKENLFNLELFLDGDKCQEIIVDRTDLEKMTYKKIFEKNEIELEKQNIIIFAKRV